MPYMLRDSTPVARKPHRCDTCMVEIESGTKYHRSVYLGDDGLYEWLTCFDCDPLTNIVWDWAGRPHEGITTEEIVEWARDHATDPEVGEQASAFLARHMTAHKAWLDRIKAVTP